MAREPGHVEGDDRGSAAAEQAPAQDPQLIKAGQPAGPATLLQTKQDLGLNLRSQAPQDDRMAAGHRAAGPAPCLKVAGRDLSPALLLPPAHVVRPAQAPAAMRLAGAGDDPARAEARQRLGLRMGEEGLQRKLQPRAMVLV